MQPGIVNHWYFKLRFYFTDIMVWNITAVYDIGFQSYRDYIYKMKVCDKAFHCKLTRRRRSYSIVITFTTLWLRCSSSSYFIHMWRKDNLFGYILWNQNIFDLLNSSLINGVMIKTYKITILCAFYFSLTCFAFHFYSILPILENWALQRWKIIILKIMKNLKFIKNKKRISFNKWNLFNNHLI